MPLNLAMNIGTWYLLGIDTRNCDYGATGTEGIRWSNPGFYIFTV
jgi:hypothetical protein